MSTAADIIRQAARLNLKDARRRGSAVHLEERCELVVAGDIHGHRRNLARIITYSALAGKPRRHLVLQELIHGPADPVTGHDRSAELLLRAARLKCAQQGQVLFVIGNHDVAQAAGSEIIKNGQSSCKAFADGIRYSFGEKDAPEILDAVVEFIMSMPLAVTCGNGVLVAHSLPSPKRIGPAGAKEILHRPFGADDLKRGGDVYEWTWGRDHTAEQLDAMASELGVDFFVLGHQHRDGGLEVLGRRAVALTSDHAQGRIIEFSTDEPLSAETAVARSKLIAALSAGG